MLSKLCIAVLVTLSSLVNAVPAGDSIIRRDPSLRLIKTSESDPGKWVTEDQKISDYKAKKIDFIDITDIKDPDTLKFLSGDGAPGGSHRVTYPTTVLHQAEANGLIAQANTTGPKSWLKTLTDFYNRYYLSTYGTQSATFLFNTVKSVANSNAKITVSQFTHSYSQPSIIARIPGSTPNLLIVGAHFDSTGGSSTARGPGADDNGSGIVVILEALRVLASSKFAPKNTIEFHFYSGEEGGLRGSGDVFRSYKSAGKSVLAFLNQDMAGYSPSGKISIYNDYADAGLTAYVRRIASAYTGATTSDTCGYGCSDHASAYSNGFPAAYACDEPIATGDPYIHSPRDTYETVQWDTVLRHIKFTIAFLVEANYL